MSDASKQADRLSAELEAKLLRRVETEWRGINYRYFKSVLRRPVVCLVEIDEPLVAWRPDLRELELSRAGVLRQSWGEVVDALERATVWQYVDEQLAVVPRDRHPAYRRICRHLGVDDLSRKPDSAEPSRRLVTRVDKLLALARSPNRHEAETAAATARRLMLKYNIEHAEPEHDHAYRYRQLGPPRGRLHEYDRRLATILSSYFFVETAWVPIYLPREGKRATVLEVCGLEANLLMAEHVYAFLRHTAARLWAAYAGEPEREPTPADRLAFLAGVMAGFEGKLAAQDRQLQEQGLVWVPAPGLGEFFRRRNPQLRLTQVGAGPWSAAYEQGSRAGRSIVLSQPLTTTSSRRGGPRALPGSRHS